MEVKALRPGGCEGDLRDLVRTRETARPALPPSRPPAPSRPTMPESTGTKAPITPPKVAPPMVTPPKPSASRWRPRETQGWANRWVLLAGTTAGSRQCCFQHVRKHLASLPTTVASSTPRSTTRQSSWR